jgi:hypothetical protein
VDRDPSITDAMLDEAHDEMLRESTLAGRDDAFFHEASVQEQIDLEIAIEDSAQMARGARGSGGPEDIRSGPGGTSGTALPTEEPLSQDEEPGLHPAPSVGRGNGRGGRRGFRGRQVTESFQARKPSTRSTDRR